jgi:hypothetical protein
MWPRRACLPGFSNFSEKLIFRAAFACIGHAAINCVFATRAHQRRKHVQAVAAAGRALKNPILEAAAGLSPWAFRP